MTSQIHHTMIESMHSKSGDRPDKILLLMFFSILLFISSVEANIRWLTVLSAIVSYSLLSVAIYETWE